MLPRSMLRSRRQFVASGLGAAVLLGRGSFALAAPEQHNWICPLLGDLHFDRLEHHDLDWLAKDHPGDVHQVQNYSRVTREYLPKLFELVKRQIDKATGPVPAVLQLGDLIEGLCGTPELAERQAKEAIELIKETDFGRPFLITKGNHDVTGPGAAEAYQQVLLPQVADQSPAMEKRAAFSQRRGGTLLAFFDAYDKASLAWFVKLLEEQRPERLIVLIHPPVVPYNARSDWHIFSRPHQQAEREKFLELLGKHRAIVLCGHLHKYCFLRRRTTSGSFVQLAISSVATDAAAEPKDARQGLEQYGPDLVELEPNHSPATVEARQALLAAERPFIEHFDYADTWGHGLLKVEGARIAADVCSGLSATPWKALDLSAHI
jgi:hypothetical protein